MIRPIIQVAEIGETPGGLVDRAVADIRQYMRQNQLRPGDILPSETALATQLGVSRTVAREAFRALAALRIIEVGNGRKARVAAPNADALSMILDHTVYTKQLSYQQVLDVRRTLELRTVGLAALRRSEAEAGEISTLASRMFEAIEQPEALMELDIQFHEVIAKASGNPLYAIIVSSFRVITRQTWHIGWRSRATLENRTENIRCHDRIAQSIVAQNPATAEAAISEHFDSAVSVLLRAGIT